MTEQSIYRFRSGKNLFEEYNGEKGYNELKQQEIYFAARDQLNDPMEGFKNIYWSGDEIVWRNLLKHYLLCLEHICLLFIAGGKEFNINASHIPVFRASKDLPTQMYLDLHQEIRQLFFNKKNINDIPNQLSSRQNPIRQNELLTYLGMLHPHALNAIFTGYEDRGLTPKRPLDDPLIIAATKEIDFARFVNAEEKLPSVKDGLEKFYAAVSHLQAQLDLIQRYNEKINETGQRNRWFLISEFPKQYVKRLEKLLYPEWYVATFSSRCDDPSMWGYYADNHKGLCLKFRTNIVHGTPTIKLHEVIGCGGSWGKMRPIYGNVDHPLHKVDYAEKHPEIDFFKSLGRLPEPTLYENWYLDESKNKSICSDHLQQNRESWRKGYWDNDLRIKTIKLKAWEHEREYRLTLNDGEVLDFSDPSQRKLKYDFQNLEGIIFGINTPEGDKLRTVQIIEEKCREKNRKDFRFYQAYYSPTDGNIGTSVMNLLQFKN